MEGGREALWDLEGVLEQEREVFLEILIGSYRQPYRHLIGNLGGEV